MTQELIPSVPDERRAGAMRIVHKYVLISAGAGMIWIPVVDVMTLAGVHVALIKAISEHYGVEFSQHTARNIVIAIGSSLIPGSIGSIIGRKALQAVPFVFGVFGGSAFSAAVSYGLGMIFIRHFEAGGTLDTFNVANLHKVFRRPEPPPMIAASAMSEAG